MPFTPSRDKYEKVLALVSKTKVQNIGRKGFRIEELVHSLRHELEKPYLAVNSIDLILEKIQYGAGPSLALKIQKILYGPHVELVSSTVSKGEQSKADFWHKDIKMRQFRK